MWKNSRQEDDVLIVIDLIVMEGMALDPIEGSKQHVLDLLIAAPRWQIIEITKTDIAQKTG